MGFFSVLVVIDESLLANFERDLDTLRTKLEGVLGEGGGESVSRGSGGSSEVDEKGFLVIFALVFSSFSKRWERGL